HGFYSITDIQTAEQTIVASTQSGRAWQYLARIAAAPHVAGTEENAIAGNFMDQTLAIAGFALVNDEYDVLLSYPTSISLELTRPRQLSFILSEPPIDSDPDTWDEHILPPYHGYSPSGDVTAEVVYANYG